MNNLLPFSAILLCIIYLSLHVILGKLRRARKRKLSSVGHGPPSYPVIGCLISFYKNRYRLLDWYTDLLTRSPTKTIVVSRFGAPRTIVTANPQNVEYILKTNFSNFPKGKPFTEILGDFLGIGIFNVDGNLWHTQRKLASHEFTARSFKDYVMNVLKEEVENKLFPLMDSLAAAEVDLQDLLRKLGFDIVCRITLGVDPSVLPLMNLMEAFDKASELSAKRGAEPVLVIWKLKRLLGIGSEKILRHSIQQIQSFVSDIIRQKRGNNNVQGEDLLSKMLMGIKMDKDKEDEVMIRDMMISFIMAGRDTTSAAMTWLFHLLSGHPNIEQQVVKEILLATRSEVESHTSGESLKELRLLKACLCESMRLYPPVAWDSKHAISRDVLPDGTAIGVGDRVTYFPYGMGRMEDLWGKDRLEFRPDRWILGRDGEGKVEALKNISPYRFPVFQAGPRVCLGKDLAFVQMRYIVAAILRRFEIVPSSSNRPVFVPFLTAHMAGGFKVSIRRRRTEMVPVVD